MQYTEFLTYSGWDESDVTYDTYKNVIEPMYMGICNVPAGNASSEYDLSKADFASLLNRDMFIEKYPNRTRIKRKIADLIKTHNKNYKSNSELGAQYTYSDSERAQMAIKKEIENLCDCIKNLYHGQDFRYVCLEFKKNSNYTIISGFRLLCKAPSGYTSDDTDIWFILKGNELEVKQYYRG